MKKVLFFCVAFLFLNNIEVMGQTDPLKIYREKFSILISVPSKIVFQNKDNAKLNESDKYELGVIADALVKNKDLKIEIAVYYDTRIDPEFSNEITQERAEKIKNYLISLGANPNNLIAKGYGDTIVVNKCKPFVKCTEAEHAANRRVEFKILNPEKLVDYKMVKK